MKKTMQHGFKLLGQLGPTKYNESRAKKDAADFFGLGDHARDAAVGVG